MGVEHITVSETSGLRGESRRRAILRVAAEMASVEGLEGLSIGELAERVGMSKSGLFAHFGSKEELQLATVGAALEIFTEEVLQPALQEPEGLARLRTLTERFLAHVEGGTFPGGCFFASVAAEVDGHPGPVRDRIANIQREWLGLFEANVRHAQQAGELAGTTDPAQVAFEVNAMLAGAHGMFLLQGDPVPLCRAREGIRRVLAALGAE